MRTTALAALSLAMCSFATAQDTYSQKPTVAPTVDRGDLPKGPVIQTTAEFWAQRFDAGPVPQWIWGATPTKNYTLRTEFAAAGVKVAKLRASADNRVVLFFNGKQVAASDEWKDGAEADVTPLIKEKNEIVAEVKNEGGQAGFVFQLVTTDEKGATKHVVSDESWLASEKKGGDGAKAKKVGTYGDAPWGKVFESVTAPGSKVPANTFVTLPGFKVEKLFTVPKDKLGSWVNITTDDKGRLIASDQGEPRTGAHHAGQGRAPTKRRRSRRSPRRSQRPKGCCGTRGRCTSCATAAPAAGCTASRRPRTTTRSTRSRS